MAKGVDGADNVVNAQAAVQESLADIADAEADLGRARRDAAREYADALDAVKDAQRDAADAEAELGRTRRDAARDYADALQGVRDAQDRLSEAQQDMAEVAAKGLNGGAAAASAYQKAMDELPPSAQKFVRYMRDEFLPMWKSVRVAAADALLPRAEKALRALSPLVKPIKTIVKDTAAVLGDLMVKAAELVSSPAWQSDLLLIGKNNAKYIGMFGDAVINLLDPLKDILVVIGDGEDSLLGRFAAWTEGLTENTAATVKAKRANGDLAAFFKKTGDVLAQWGRIIGNISKGLFNIGRDSAPAGKALTDSLETATEDFVTWTEEHSQQIKDFFTDLVPVVETVGGILLDVFKILGGIMSNPDNLRMVTALRDDLVPALDRMVDAFQNSGGGQKLVDIIVDLADTITSLIESGAFGHFLDTLGAIVGFLKDMSANPIGQKVFAVLFTLAGIVAPLGLAAGWLIKIASAAQKLSKVTGLSKVIGYLSTLTGLGVGAGGVGAGGVGGAGKPGSTGGGGTPPVVAAPGTKVPGKAPTKVPGKLGGKLGSLGGKVGKFGGKLLGGGLIGIGQGGLLTWENSTDDKGNPFKSEADYAAYMQKKYGSKWGSPSKPGSGALLPGKTGKNYMFTAPKVDKSWWQTGWDSTAGFFKGLWDGLVSWYHKADGWWDENVLNPVKDFFGIHSPSTVFAAIGGDIVAGFIEGLASMPGKIATWITGIGASLSTGVDDVQDVVGGEVGRRAAAGQRQTGRSHHQGRVVLHRRTGDKVVTGWAKVKTSGTRSGAAARKRATGKVG